MFNLDVQIINLAVTEQEESIEVQLTVGLAVPGPPSPQGQPETAFLPAGVIRFTLGREPAIKTGQTLVEKGEALPEPPKDSGIIIPDSPADVDRAAKIVEDIKGPSDSKR